MRRGFSIGRRESGTSSLEALTAGISNCMALLGSLFATKHCYAAFRHLVTVLVLFDWARMAAYRRSKRGPSQT
jgi:hypothetical protein